MGSFRCTLRFLTVLSTDCSEISYYVRCPWYVDGDTWLLDTAVPFGHWTIGRGIFARGVTNLEAVIRVVANS